MLQATEEILAFYMRWSDVSQNAVYGRFRGGSHRSIKWVFNFAAELLKIFVTLGGGGGGGGLRYTFLKFPRKRGHGGHEAIFLSTGGKLLNSSTFRTA